MKKGLKLTVASVMAMSAVTPVAVLANEAPAGPAAGFYTADGYYSPVQFKNLTNEQKQELLKRADLVLVLDEKVYPRTVVGKSDAEIATLAIPVAQFEAENGKLTDKGYTGAQLAVQSVSAINSNTLAVTFEGTLTAQQKESAKFAVTKDGVAVSVNAEWDGNSAKLTRTDDSKLDPGSYKVVVTGLDLAEGKDSVTGEVEAEKATSISITTDRIKNATGQTLAFEVLNQYKEKLTVAASALTIVAFNTTDSNRGVTEAAGVLDASSANVGDKIKVTAYLTADPTVKVVKELTVANISVGSVEIGDLVANEGTKRVTVGDSSVKLPITLKDDAGNAFIPTAGAIASGAIVDGLVYTYSGITALSVDSKGVFTATATAKPAVITITNPATGDVVSKQLTINDAAKATTATVGALTADVISGDANNSSKLEVNFKDQYGEDIVLANSTALSSTDFVVSVTGAGTTPIALGANVEKNGNKNYLTFTNITSATAGTYTVALTNKVTGAQVTKAVEVKAERAPKTVTVKTAPAAQVAKDGTTTVAFEVKDQYGKVVTGTMSGYKIALEKTSGADVIFDSSSKFNATATIPTSTTLTSLALGTETFTAKLTKDSDSSVVSQTSFTVKVVSATDAIASYQVKDVPTLYASKADHGIFKDANEAGEYDVALDIVGLDANGKTIALTAAQRSAMVLVSQDPSIVSVASGKLRGVSAGTTSVDVYKDNTFADKIATISVTSSDAKPVIGSIVLPETATATIGSTGTKVNADLTEASIKDQYGKELIGLVITSSDALSDAGITVASSNADYVKVADVKVVGTTLQIVPTDATGTTTGTKVLVTLSANGITKQVLVTVEDASDN